MPVPLRCDPALFQKDLSGKVIIVTGANGGIGLETSRQLCQQGATVILACRNEERGEKAAFDVTNNNNNNGGGTGIYLFLDLANLKSVRDFVTNFSSKYDRLDALVNNAGVMMCPHWKTEDGFEMQFGCNHLGHFLLTSLLTPMLLKTSETTKEPSRLVILSSCAATEMGMGIMTMAPQPMMQFDDLNWTTRKYDKMAAYQQSKLANYLHALEASRRYDSTQLLCMSLHPGWVHSNLDQHVMGENVIGNAMRKLCLKSGHMISPTDGAQTSLHCLLEDADNLDRGAFYSQFGVYKDAASKAGGWPMKLPNPNATVEAASKLWEMSEMLVTDK